MNVLTPLAGSFALFSPEFAVAQAGLEPQLILLPQAPVPSLKSLPMRLLTLPVS